MKKTFALLLIFIIIITVNVNAQTKIAYIRIDDIVGVMPELGRDRINIDTVGQQYVADSIMPRLNYVQSEYQRKIQDYADTSKPKGIRDAILKDLQNYKDELDGANELIQQAQQYHQKEFLKPYYAKAKKAIEAVAKEKGYTHVMSSDNFLVAPEADDISMAVLAKLGIKLPNQSPSGKPGQK